MVVYLDSVFFYNALADNLLLLAAGRLAGLPLQRRRIFLAALLGGVYAAAVFLPGAGILSRWWMKLLSAAVMVRIAFGKGNFFLRRYLLFLLVSGGFAGVELALCSFAGTEGGIVPFSLPLFFACFALCWLLLGVVFRGSGAPVMRGQLLQVCVTRKGRSSCFAALSDSGCTLRDPADGRAVLVAERSVLEELLSDEERAVLNGCGAPGDAGLTQLAFQSLGGSGWVSAFRVEELRIGKTVQKDALVAIHPGGFGGEMFHALWGGEENGK